MEMCNIEADYQERVSEATQAEESPQGTETLKEGKKEPQLDGEYRHGPCLLPPYLSRFVLKWGVFLVHF